MAQHFTSAYPSTEITRKLTNRTYQNKVEEALRYILNKTNFQPEIIIQLGTGLGGLRQRLENEQCFSFSQIPHFPKLSIVTHEANLLLGELSGKKVALLQGRAHFYEGYSSQETTLPLRVLSLLGGKIFIVTNSAGGLSNKLNAGDLMLIEDHINAMGENPLRGPNVEKWGPRFPDMSAPYSNRLMEIMTKKAKKSQISLQKGVYVAIPGPSLETPAETRVLQRLGADAVGMSTVPEVIVARHAGFEVLGISVIANINDPENFQPIIVEEILAKMKEIEPKFQQLLADAIYEM